MAWVVTKGEGVDCHACAFTDHLENAEAYKEIFEEDGSKVNIEDLVDYIQKYDEIHASENSRQKHDL